MPEQQAGADPPERGSGEPAPAAAARLSLWGRIAKRIWGYDFFVSYNWATGGQYAVALAERLRERGYDCFLDQSEFAAGDDWRREAQSALRNTGRLVVIATREAIARSEAVQHEIELFTRRSERVIPIVFGERFSEEEKRRFGALRRIPDSTIDLVEEESRLDKGPSEKVLDQLIQAHRLVRRRSVRKLIVTAAVVVLAAAALVAARQGLVARSAEQVNMANLLRQTDGPKLEESLSLARQAKRASRLALASPEAADQAIRDACELLPSRIGEPLATFPEAAAPRLMVSGENVAVLRAEADPFAVVAKREEGQEGFRWREQRRFSRAAEGRLLGDPHGRPLAADEGWLFLDDGDGVAVWSIAEDALHDRLRCADRSGAAGEIELLAVSRGARQALVACDGELLVYRLGESPRRWRAVPPAVPEFALHAVSRSGELVAWARQNDFGVVDLAGGRRILSYPITQGGGHEEAVRFIEHPEDRFGGPPAAVFVAWSANQVQASMTAARSDAPSSQAGIWNLGRGERPSAALTAGPAPWVSGDPAPAVAGGDEAPRAPDLRLVRAAPFETVFSPESRYPSLAVLDPENPVQWLDLESQISFTLGAGAGTAARFAASDVEAQELLIVHQDGTARLWDLDGREELLRFTARDATIRDATFLGRGETRLFVTLDSAARLQTWSPERPTAGEPACPADARRERLNAARP